MPDSMHISVSVQEIGQGNKAPSEWLGEIEPTFLSYEAVPVLKFPFFNEVSTDISTAQFQCMCDKDSAWSQCSTVACTSICNDVLTEDKMGTVPNAITCTHGIASAASIWC